MRTATTVGVFTICILWLGAAGAHAQTCEPDGEVQFLCGPVSPEDLAPVPQSPWVVVSSMVDEGHLYLADTRDHTAILLGTRTRCAARERPVRGTVDAATGPGLVGGARCRDRRPAS